MSTPKLLLEGWTKNVAFRVFLEPSAACSYMTFREREDELLETGPHVARRTSSATFWAYSFE
jgi:hypothetical protein